MDIIQQNRTLLRLVMALVLINACIVGAIVWQEWKHNDVPSAQLQREEQRPATEEKAELSDVLKSELNLTDDQCRRIEQLRADFRIKERELSQHIRDERDSMNASMFHASTDDALVQALARRVADNEYAMEMLRYDQAKAFKEICTKEQAKKFERLVKDIRDYFRPNPRHGKRGYGGRDDRRRRSDGRPPGRQDDNERPRDDRPNNAPH